MIKKTFLILAITTLILSSAGMAFALNIPIEYGLTHSSNFILQNNVVQSNKTVDVVKSIEGKVKTAHKGQNVTIKYVVSNKGTKPIYNVVVDGQCIHKNLGTIKPGETKKVTYTEYISTDKEIKEEFGPGASVSNPYPMGGDNLYFNDYKGTKHGTSFEIFNIKLI
jgi:hypothetical protein